LWKIHNIELQYTVYYYERKEEEERKGRGRGGEDRENILHKVNHQKNDISFLDGMHV
jgi:hypothetical protein